MKENEVSYSCTFGAEPDLVKLQDSCETWRRPSRALRGSLARLPLSLVHEIV